MKLSTKGHCAITAMLQMALPQSDGPISLLKLSKCQSVSLSYLEQILAQLRQQGLVKGMRGPGGGYMLAKSANEVTVGEIVEAVGEYDAGRWSTPLVKDSYAGVSDEAREHWNTLSACMFELLNQLTLAELINRQGDQQQLWQDGKKPANFDLNAA